MHRSDCHQNWLIDWQAHFQEWTCQCLGHHNISADKMLLKAVGIFKNWQPPQMVVTQANISAPWRHTLQIRKTRENTWNLAKVLSVTLNQLFIIKSLLFANHFETYELTFLRKLRGKIRKNTRQREKFFQKDV